MTNAARGSTPNSKAQMWAILENLDVDLMGLEGGVELLHVMSTSQTFDSETRAAIDFLREALTHRAASTRVWLCAAQKIAQQERGT